MWACQAWHGVVLVTTVSPAKTAELIEMQCWAGGRPTGPKEPYIRWGATWRILLNDVRLAVIYAVLPLDYCRLLVFSSAYTPRQSCSIRRAQWRHYNLWSLAIRSPFCETTWHIVWSEKWVKLYSRWGNNLNEPLDPFLFLGGCWIKRQPGLRLIYRWPSYTG